jgi:hypothetical protein
MVAVCGCVDDSARFPCAVAQAVNEEIEEATGLLALCRLARGQGHAAQPQEHVVGVDIRPQGPGGDTGVEERGDGRDQAGAALDVWVPTGSAPAR